MASFKFWFYFFFIALLFSSFHARASVRDPFMDSIKRALIQSAKEMFKQSLKRQEEYHYDFNRVSPGGSDPKHH